MSRRTIEKKFQKAVVSLVIVAMILSCLPLNLGTAYGETVTDYDVDKAIAYAKEHYDDKSTTTTEGQDCVQFLRECLEAGGVPKDENRVNEDGPYGYTVEGYMQYLVENGYAFIYPLKTEKQDWTTPQWYVRASDNENFFSVGDGVIYYCNSCHKYIHMSINTGVNKDGFVLYHAQNKAVGGETLCLIDCINCNANRENISLYSLHITSSENGYSDKYNDTTATNVTARRTSDNQISVTWDPVAGAAGYKVFVKAGINRSYNPIGDVSGTSITYTETNAGANYYFAVRPYFHEDGKTYVGKLSEAAYNNEYLLTPTGVTAVLDPASNNVRVTWNKVAGEPLYEVYRSTNPNSGFKKVFELEGTSCILGNLAPETTYYYKVRAVNRNNPTGNSDYSTAAQVTTGKLSQPVVTTSIIDGGIRVSWEKVPYANRYEVLRASSANGTYYSLATVEGTALNNTSVVAGRTYYYKVKAYNTANPNVSITSNVTAQIAKMEAPTLTKGTNSAGKPVISWGTVLGADRYDVYRATNANGAYTRVLSTTGTSYTDASASAGRTYYYKVLAVSNQDADANAESNLVSITCTASSESVIDRYSGNNRYETAFAVADALKDQQGVDKFENIIVAYGDNYADALAGSYLAKVKNAPILVVNSRMESYVKDYIDENTNKAGTIYLLGGEGVVSRNFANSLTSSGYNVKRLGGANRYETNMSILRESGVTNEDILVCSASSFADSLSASAVGKPILLVNTSLYDEQKDLLSTFDTDRFYLIGGTGAVTASVGTELRQYGTVERVAGSNRYTTSKAIADKFFAGGSDTIVIASGDDFPDGLTGGPLAMSLSSPLFLVNDRNTSSAAEYVADHGLDVITVIGGTGVVSDDAANAIAGRK